MPKFRLMSLSTYAETGSDSLMYDQEDLVRMRHGICAELRMPKDTHDIVVMFRDKVPLH